MRVLGTLILLVVYPALTVQIQEDATAYQSGCNTNVTHDKVVLKRATLISKYVFTGKVHGVNLTRRTKIYKVNIRRVLKGDLNDIGVKVRFDRARSLRFSDATIFVLSSFIIKCPTLRLGTYAIFLTENKRPERPLRLSLVLEPVLLTLKNIDIIEAAIKGT